MPRCHVVARVEIDGYGRVDSVALVRRGNDGAAWGSVTVRVLTGQAAW